MGSLGEEIIQISDLKPVHRASSPMLAYNYMISQSPTNIETQSNTKINTPVDAWLPITASRNGNGYYSAFHTLNSGIGFQALMLPAAFRVLGWAGGITWLSLAFGWQFYTIWLLVQLHEPVPGIRYSRYLQLSMASFGEKLGKLLCIMPLGYLSGATCVMLIMTAGDSMKIFMKMSSESQPLTTIECYLLFVCIAIIIAQHPSLNSIAWISFIGSVVAVCYCTLLWAITINKNRPYGISYAPIKPEATVASVFGSFNALGIVALAFRGHNLILEIQATIPSNEKRPSKVSMWRGVKFAYLLILMCLFPLAIAGFWAYGSKIPDAGGMLNALYIFHRHDTSKFVLILAPVLVMIHCLSSFQIYATPIFDNLEFAYVTRKKKECPRWIRLVFRVCFGCLVFFIAVAFPFIRGLAGLFGGIVLPVTFVYPCYMWIIIKKPRRHSSMWWINYLLGSLGIVLSVLVFAGGVYTLVHPGLDVRFFKP